MDINELPKFKVEVCFTHYLDPEKILSYNGSEFDFEAYDFLYEAAVGNYHFNDSGSVFNGDMWQNYLYLSSQVLEKFAIDIDDVFLACSYVGFRDKCINLFKLNLVNPYAPCYESIVQPYQAGPAGGSSFFFYFNSSKSLGKYTKTEGAHIVISDPDDFIPFTDGSFIPAGNIVRLSLEMVHKKQTRSFKRAECVHKTGRESVKRS